MDCPRLESVSTFSDGELPEPEAQAVREHVSECEECAQFLEWCLTLQGLLEERNRWAITAPN